MAANRWTPNALPVAQVETITIANTWAANDTATVTINGKTITLTVGTTATTAQVATELATALNSKSTALGTGYSASERGPNIPEFAEFTAVVSGSTVVCTGNTKGKPFTMTTGETTAGSGTCSRATTVAASGPNHWSSTANWSLGTVPVNGDTVVFDQGNVDCLYGLPAASYVLTGIVITNDYTGRLGLAFTNVDNPSMPYREYRSRAPQWTGAGTSLVQIGFGTGAGSTRINLDFGTSTMQATVLNTGNKPDGVPYAVRIIGGGASSTLSVTKGYVGYAPDPADTASLATLTTGYRDSQASDANVYCGDGATITTANVNGGIVSLNKNITTIVQQAGTIYTDGAITVTTARISGGTLVYRSSGTLSALFVDRDGVADFSQDGRGRTVSAADITEGATILDPNGTVTWTAGIDCNDCDLSQVTILPARNRKVSFAAVT